MPSTAVSPNAAREDGCAAGPSAAAAAHASRRAARFIALQYRIVTGALADRVCAEVDRAAGELVQLAVDLVRIPTVNPPGEAYEACARFIGDDLQRRGFAVEYIVADGRPEHSARYPRVNVVGSRRGGPGAVVHLNGHMDVVPPGDGWTVDPFAGVVRDDRKSPRLNSSHLVISYAVFCLTKKKKN